MPYVTIITHYTKSLGNLSPRYEMVPTCNLASITKIGLEITTMMASLWRLEVLLIRMTMVRSIPWKRKVSKEKSSHDLILWLIRLPPWIASSTLVTFDKPQVMLLSRQRPPNHHLMYKHPHCIIAFLFFISVHVLICVNDPYLILFNNDKRGKIVDVRIYIGCFVLLDA